MHKESGYGGDEKGAGRPLDRERFIKEHAPQVKYIAQRLAAKLPSQVEIDDLISTGIMGLLDAIDKYDPKKGVKFGTYAQFRIKGAMIDSLREMDWVPRSVRDRADEIAKVYSSLEEKFGRPAAEAEVADYLGISVDELMETLGELNGSAILSIEDLSVNQDIDGNILDIVADENGIDPQSILGDRELKQVLGKAIDGLSEKERLVVALYYYEELTMKEIGVVLNVTESRVCQLHNQAMLRLKGRLRGKV